MFVPSIAVSAKYTPSSRIAILCLFVDIAYAHDDGMGDGIILKDGADEGEIAITATSLTVDRDIPRAIVHCHKNEYPTE